jgi:hypothetical protein
MSTGNVWGLRSDEYAGNLKIRVLPLEIKTNYGDCQLRELPDFAGASRQTGIPSVTRADTALYTAKHKGRTEWNSNETRLREKYLDVSNRTI